MTVAASKGWEWQHIIMQAAIGVDAQVQGCQRVDLLLQNDKTSSLHHAIRQLKLAAGSMS